MPPNPLSNVLPYPQREPEPLPEAAEIMLGDDTPSPFAIDGAETTELPDGSAIIDLNPSRVRDKPDKFDANLALEMDEGELNKIAAELLTGIEADNASRQDWLTQHADGMRLLGLVLEDSRGDAGSSSAPLDGMSNVWHPLLLEACTAFQANARGELLPAAGPCKVRDDRPQPSVEAPPPAPMMPPGIGHNGGPAMDGMAAPMPNGAPQPPVPPMAPPMAGAPAMPPGPMPPPLAGGAMAPVPDPVQGEKTDRDALAAALEKDFNHYLTVTAKEYYPDTDRMLFSVGFGGQGVKKVYNCPIRRRPVSESIAMEDFIVSNALTDLGNAARITHRFRMRPATLRRMQLLGVYVDIALGMPTQATQPNAVDQAKADIAGVQPQVQDPKDADYELYECHCELELDDYAPPQFKDKALALPYRVTIEKESQKVLEIRRNWREDDEQCLALEHFVEFAYNKAFGFYGIGLLHILGNTTRTLTTAWRELVDSGMYANFPGFIYAKGAGRQLTNQFRVPPGGGVGLDIGLQKLSDAVMALPYKDLGPAFTAFITHVEELGQRVGGTANIQVGEGRQDAPVGTTLALIEQATKPIGAVLKRLHSAQSKELQLLKDRFREDPEAFWRFNRRPAMPWQKAQFVAALDDFDLVPVSDPNNPTGMHRAAKANALQSMAMAAPGLLDVRKVFKRVARDLEINDADDLLAPPAPPQAPPVDQGKMAMAQAKMAGDKLKAETEMQKAQFDAQDSAAMRESKVRELELKIELENIKQQGLIERDQLKLAASVAQAAEKTEQADRHLEANLISSHAAGHADRAHRERLAETAAKAAARRKPKTKEPA